MVTPPDEPVSPELALVDSGLRARLRDETPTAEQAPTLAAPELSPIRRSRRRRRSPLVLALALFVVATAGIAVYAGRDGALSPAPTISPTRSIPAASEGAGDRSGGRAFAWAPVKGASRYDSEIRRGGVVVYAVRTRAPHLRVPARWQRNGRTMTLSPGVYQWYVWPLVGMGNSRRRAPAVVATTFEISG